MDTRIQFRVSEETKQLAQRAAERQGRTLSEACRALTEQLADEQRKLMDHNDWLTAEVNAAFDQFESGRSHFVKDIDAHDGMERFKESIRQRS